MDDWKLLKRYGCDDSQDASMEGGVAGRREPLSSDWQMNSIKPAAPLDHMQTKDRESVSVFLCDLDRVYMRRPVHIRAKHHRFPIRREGDVRFEPIIVSR